MPQKSDNKGFPRARFEPEIYPHYQCAKLLCICNKDKMYNKGLFFLELIDWKHLVDVSKIMAQEYFSIQIMMNKFVSRYPPPLPWNGLWLAVMQVARYTRISDDVWYSRFDPGRLEAGCEKQNVKLTHSQGDIWQERTDHGIWNNLRFVMFLWDGKVKRDIRHVEGDVRSWWLAPTNWTEIS